MAPPSKEDVKKCIKKRTDMNDQIGRFQAFLSDSTNQNELSALQVRLEKIELLWDEFDKIQTKIETTEEPLDGASPVNHRALFEEAYYDVVGKAKGFISKLVKPPTKLPVPSMSISSDTQTIGNVKLPTINLPIFSGAYDQWMNFHDTFNSIIHTNTSLTEIQKFHYLRASLDNEAAQVIHALDISGSNYAVAWTLLKERFQNKRLIVHNHVKALFELPVVNKESPIALRQLLDNVLKHLRALKALKEPTEHWDTLIIYLLSTKLDPTTKREWETSVLKDDPPTMDEITKFLTNRCQLLETLDLNKTSIKSAQPQINNKYPPNKNKGINRVTAHIATRGPICEFCKLSHTIYKCAAFLKLPIKSRMEEVTKLKLCCKCLRQTNHNLAECKAGACRVCNKSHNTLLHKDEMSSNDQKSNSVVAHCSYKYEDQVLLSTALVYTYDSKGAAHECRVLLDSASQSNFISKELLELLELSSSKIKLPVTGINQSVTTATVKTEVKIKSRYNNFNTTITCLLLPRITESLPTLYFSTQPFNLPDNLKLADPTFNRPGKIDMLLGAGIFWDLLCVGQIKLASGQPILQKTHLGWIASGNLQDSNKINKSSCNLNIYQRLDQQLTRFWQLEDCSQASPYSQEELTCEQYFEASTKRDETGRFVVALPIREGSKSLGESKHLALKRLHSIERKLAQQPWLRDQYIDFMREYEHLEHMRLTEPHEEQVNVYYIPHHAVVKPSSTTTKVRVVFDASAKTSNGLSLNDKLLVGPTIQDDLFSIIARFRIHAFAFTADIAKMYRQIKVREEDQNMQLILWREDSKQPIKCYTLKTVTYGTASAPYLAVRCLKELALENQSEYPSASNIIQRDFYVDDLITGTDSLDDALKLKEQVVSILKTAGFELRKFASNNKRIAYDDISKETSPSLSQITKNDESIKALGLQWNTNTDNLQYTVKVNSETRRFTKRTILSTIAQIFDPLGLLGPIMVKGKIILQKIWQIQLDWDESLPPNLHTLWSQFQDQIKIIEKIYVPRHVRCLNPTDIQFHGFCDASEAAYGACIYIRSTNLTGEHQARLLCAKSRVAPLKNVSLPRLELCGALLLAQLMSKTIRALSSIKGASFYWCDSTVTLAWISSQPSRWKTFVANRVAEIQGLTDPSNWRHISSQQNPADIISRGNWPNQLLENGLWWNGPAWLTLENHSWPHFTNFESSEVPEERTTTVVCVSTIDSNFNIFERFSTFVKLQRVIAYILRFKDNLAKPKETRNLGILNVQELDQALRCLLRLAQSQEFKNDLQSLQRGASLDRTSQLLMLNPFLDGFGLIRVGGRLSNASIEYDQKHPVVLAQKHPLTKLLIWHEHIKLLHAGPQAVLASIRTHFWPLAARSTVRKILRNCIKCFRARPRDTVQLMGSLPNTRVTPARPFLISGIDYAGPFLIKERKHRNVKFVKSYLCLFICFTTKAVHLELVSDATSEAFINAFKRFISRRGLCTDLFSDNSTTFCGAYKELKELATLLASEPHKVKFSEYLTQNHIKWHFIPPRAPHFGGLWEAAIKSAKHHLKRIVGNASLTFEELYTVLAQIEACLNSRPLVPMSDDPGDLIPLTPGHFLIGDLLTAIPQGDLQTLPLNKLSQYQRIQQLVQHFWSRWSKEYLGHLQQRPKWKMCQSHKLELGCLVVIKEDNLPPLKWQMGRIVKLYPGKDNIVRVVDIKTATNVVKRPVSKVCVLPIDTLNTLPII